MKLWGDEARAGGQKRKQVEEAQAQLGERESSPSFRQLRSTTPTSVVMLAMNTSPDNTWLIDSSASHHICNNRDMFLPHMIKKTNYTIRLGDMTTVEAIEQGLIPINSFRINALFIPLCRISLLSISKLNSELQWFTSFAQSKCTVHDTTGQEILRTPC